MAELPTTQIPQLTPAQERQVHAAACEVVAAAVRNRPETPLADLPPVILEMPVMGAFVTLKRGTRLRACCGVLGRPMPLLQSVRQAAWRTATEDTRFPTISPIELPCLHLDVSLLHGFRVLDRQGPARLASVEVGRHGLQIQRGNSAGLLLPNVATEQGYGAEEFLRQACLKAGLPATAWEDEQSILQTFETCAIAGDLLENSTGATAEPAPLMSRNELQSLLRHCAANLGALVQGATPSYYAADCPDGSVNGMTLSLSAAGTEALHLFQMSLRPGMPLQSTLFQLTDTAANLLKSGGWKPPQGQLQIALSLLSDPAMHGVVAEYDLRGFDPAQRAVFVFEGNRSAWCFDPDVSAVEALRQAIDASGLKGSRSASVFSFAAQCSEARMMVSNTPRPSAGPATRPAAVAGAFYPKRADELTQLVDSLLSPPDQAPAPWPAVMVPHAGLIYSGRIAGRVFQRVQLPDTAIIICPKHSRLGVDWAVAPHEKWSIPGATLEGDVDLARQLVQSIPGLELDADAHRQEHAIEVQLPLLARLAPHIRVVGIALGGPLDFERCREFATGLASLLRQSTKRPLLIISSDLNHYASEAENRRLDEMAMNAIEQLDPEAAYHAVADRGISMCGMRPAVVVMETLKQLGGLQRCERVAYATSAEVTGDASRVVGYAGMLFE